MMDDQQKERISSTKNSQARRSKPSSSSSTTTAKHNNINSKKKNKTTTQTHSAEFYKQRKDAADAFWCPVSSVRPFTVTDTFNPRNQLHGFQCTKNGVMIGSLYITHVTDSLTKDDNIDDNDDEYTTVTQPSLQSSSSSSSSPQLIYGSSKLSYPYKKGTTHFLTSFVQQQEQEQEQDDQKLSLDEIHKTYYFSQKWNGTNVSFFKYKDHRDKLCITAKTKGSVQLTDTHYGKFLTECLKCLLLIGITERIDLLNNPPALLRDFVEMEQYQSITFEMCGQNIPHLVKYPFDISLKPLFYTTHDGKVKPIMHVHGIKEYGPFEFTDTQDVINMCVKLQREDLEANIQFRQENNLSCKFEYEHFVAEGYVLYLCDANGFVVNRIMYKVKPSDIEEVHWSKFDEKKKSQVRDVLNKMKQRNLDINDEEALRTELDMARKEWLRFGKDVIAYRNELEGGTQSPDQISKRGGGASVGRGSRSSTTRPRKHEESRNRTARSHPNEQEQQPASRSFARGRGRAYRGKPQNRQSRNTGTPDQSQSEEVE